MVVLPRSVPPNWNTVPGPLDFHLKLIFARVSVPSAGAALLCGRDHGPPVRRPVPAEQRASGIRGIVCELISYCTACKAIGRQDARSRLESPCARLPAGPGDGQHWALNAQLTDLVLTWCRLSGRLKHSPLSGFSNSVGRKVRHVLSIRYRDLGRLCHGGAR